MATTGEIVQKLWDLCRIPRDDGITYHQYVTELTLLLFLEMAKETTKEDIPDGLRTALREPRHLERLVSDLDALDWFSAKVDGLGDCYEGLLEKNANETKSGAGQYFTPRALIDAMVAVTRPAPGEHIQDPAAGTGGFLIAADTFIKAGHDENFALSDKLQEFQKKQAFIGLELVPETRRLGLMNCMLHDIEGPPDSEGAIRLGDTLSSIGANLPQADVILTNPPFGTKKGGGRPTRDDFTYPTSNKQLAFLEHIYRGLEPGGRAAVVVPDNVLFEEGVGRDIRGDLMDKCDLHTILRLPTGIFYAQGVKTNVLFFTRGKTDRGQTKDVWVYDLRANAPSFGKRTPFTAAYLAPFVTAYGADPKGRDARTPRIDEGHDGRFRRFTREDLAKRNDNLDLLWLKDASAESSGSELEPSVIAAEIRTELEGALEALAELEAMLLGEAHAP